MRSLRIKIDTSTAIAIVSCSYIAWKQTSDWVKPQFLRKKKKDEKDKDANDDLASPLVVVRKMREVLSLTSDEVDEVLPDDLPWYKLNASFLSLLHLNTEIRLNHPGHRDQNYSDSGQPISDQELRFLAENLDYADWAYDKSKVPLRTLLAEKDFDLLRQDLVTEPGKVAHFIAVHYDRKQVLIALKGTSTLSDALTDVLCKAHEHKLDGPFVEGYDCDTIRCHEGIYTAAKLLADEIQDLVEKLVLPNGFNLILCGHSLGAGTACLLGILLRSRIPTLRKDHKRLTVLAYATPPVLNLEAAVACAPFMTSVINDYDMVPRMSLSNLVIMNKLVVQVNETLEKANLSPTSFRQLKKLTKDLMKYDETTLMTCDELDDFFVKCHGEEDADGPNNLFVPGRVVMLYEKGVKQQRQDDSSSTNKEFGGVVTNGGNKMLRMIETSGQMLTDHFCTQYRLAFSTMLGDEA